MRYSRSQIGLRPAGPGPGRLDPRHVVGIALHWPAMATPIKTVDGVKRALVAWQRFHMDTRGWSDIAYQEAIDQAGNVYALRGLRTQSGANGNQPLNEAYGALLLVLAPGETPSPKMIAAVKRRIRRHREIFPRSTKIVGHGQIRPGGTTCPGPITQRLIDAGAFHPERKS